VTISEDLLAAQLNKGAAVLLGVNGVARVKDFVFALAFVQALHVFVYVIKTMGHAFLQAFRKFAPRRCSLPLPLRT